MARKSRKAQAQPVAEVKKETAALPTAIYARLSVENSGKDDDGNSLQNQIAVCEDYLDGCPHPGSRRSTRTTAKPGPCSTVRHGTA